MASFNPERTLPPAIAAALRGVRWRLRLYAWLEGFALLAILAAGAFWLGLVVDWLLEPPPAVRLVGLVAVASVAAWIGYRYILRRVFARISDASVALILERHFAGLGDHVLTTVDLADVPSGRSPHPELAERTRTAAIDAIKSVHVAGVFNRRPLLRTAVVAVSLVASVVAFGLLAGETFGFWLERIALSEQRWPRRVRLEVLGFPPDESGRRIEKVARNDTLDLEVHADITGEMIAPEQVELRYRLNDGRRGRDLFTRVGEALPGRDPFQRFRYQFKDVRSNLSLDVVGGDDRVDDLQIVVVDRPQLIWMELDCQYPAYLERGPQTLAVSGGMQIPEGTVVAVRAQSNKPLVEVRVESERRASGAPITPAAGPTDSLEFAYGALTADDLLKISLLDIDGVSSKQPYRLSMSVLPDEVPGVAVLPRGIGSAVTPDAIIPLAGDVTDDYGLEEIWIEYQVDDGQPERVDFPHDAAGRQSVDELAPFDLRGRDAQTGSRRLVLQPEQKLTFTVAASDRYDLTEEPHVGTSQRFTLDIVTPEKLLALIERRELALRQRFEAIYNKIIDTRDLLGRVEFSDAGDESDDDAEEHEQAQHNSDQRAERALARRRLRAAGAHQNIVQSTDETLGVAEGFDDLNAQLVNNRIGNRELESRIREQIALPLHTLAEGAMTDLRRKVKQLEGLVDDRQAGPGALDTAIQSAEAVLTEMEQILERMRELETYNEVVSLLRGIIDDQKQLNEKTKDRQKSKLRSLLED